MTLAVPFVPRSFAKAATERRHEIFLALSTILIGENSIDIGLARRLHAALAAASSTFDSDAESLLTLIHHQRLDPATLQSVLNRDRSPLDALPRKIMQAWCRGLVGEEDRVRCIAYEDALNAVFVADVLKPPTYAYGKYGSWSRPPLDNEAQRV